MIGKKKPEEYRQHLLQQFRKDSIDPMALLDQLIQEAGAKRRPEERKIDILRSLKSALAKPYRRNPRKRRKAVSTKRA